MYSYHKASAHSVKQWCPRTANTRTYYGKKNLKCEHILDIAVGIIIVTTVAIHVVRWNWSPWLRLTWLKVTGKGKISSKHHDNWCVRKITFILQTSAYGPKYGKGVGAKVAILSLTGANAYVSHTDIRWTSLGSQGNISKVLGLMWGKLRFTRWTSS